jgi:outer membrane protein TolC
MKRIFSTFVMLIAALVSLSAQQVEGTESSTLRFSLRQAQDYALEHSRTLQNSALSVRQAEADKWTSIASMLPQVNASLDYSNSLGYKMELGAMSISMPPS